MNLRSAGILAALVFLCARPVHTQTQALVIEGGTLIDGNGGDPVKNAVVVIEGSRIKAVGAKGSVVIPAAAKVIDAAGKTILPGLIDAHIHALDYFPPLFLHYGVTTVFDTANPTQWILAQRDAVNKGHIRGPRFFATGGIIDGPAERGDPNDRREAYRLRVRNVEEARTVTRSLIKQGVDGIKVHEALTPELLKAVVEEAHQAGLVVVGHSHDAREAIEAGIRYMEHPYAITHTTIDPAKRKDLEAGRLPFPEADMDLQLFDPVIDLMVRNEVYFNPTFTRAGFNILPEKQEWADLVTRLLQDPSYAFINAGRREAWLRAVRTDALVDPVQLERRMVALRKVQEFTRKFVKAGGKVITGPDSGPSSPATNMAGLAMHIEMQALVDAGLTPMEAILSSTKWSAEQMKKQKDLGTVEPGKLADIIIVDGDPLRDIRATRAVSTVIIDGKVVDSSLDPKFRNPLPRPFFGDIPSEDPAPEVHGLQPSISREGGAPVEIELTGRKFNPRAVVRFDTTDLPTRYLSDSKLTATISDALLKKVGTYALTVVNPGSPGGTSRGVYFVVAFKD